MRRFYISRLVLCLFLALFLFPGKILAADETRIPDGIYAQGISLGGMTRSEATQALDEYFQAIAASSFRLTCMDGQTVEIPISEWGLTWDSNGTVRQALRMASSGRLIHRYKDLMNLKHGNLYLETHYDVDYDMLRYSLAEAVAEHDNPAVNATIALQSDGSFAITQEGTNGVVTDEDATIALINEQLNDNFGQQMSATAITRTDTPSITRDELLMIKDQLGTFTTNYSESSKNRKTNIEIATSYLNGLVVLPGETISISETIKPRTEENGYALAAQYSSGESEQALGGGICQVSTTIYNALIRAELQIDERHNHSMVVSYVDWGTDAAIADTAKDLIFTNNLQNPIYIYGKADGDYLTFSIYGVEYRPANRTIEFVAKTTHEEWPKEKKVKYSDEYKKGTSHTSGTKRPEVTATLTKVVYVDGVETERELMHTDYYMASPIIITMGTG
ncbi:MAG: VanW family protein [Lachnospiraceae bacterium]|nr:VanW family protein [Lachnospiraceae bacterium]